MWNAEQTSGLEVCGCYYLKQPNDTAPISIRASKDALLSWLEDIISQTLTGQKAPSPEPTTKLEDRIKQLKNGLSLLSNFFKKRRKRGVVFIDGLDSSLSETERKDFLSILPLELESGICVVFSATSGEVIPNEFLEATSPDSTINMVPLTLPDCISYISRQLPAFTFEQARLLAQRTEGHPLYMRYLIGSARQQIHDNNVADWLAHIPVIGGDITHYYTTLWRQIREEPNRLSIALTVSAQRGSVPRSVLYEMLPKESQVHFESQYPQIAHLFKGKEKISLYHDSFRQFLVENAATRFPSIHDQIADFCARNTQEPYAIANLVYHQIQSSEPTKGIDKCSQDWADRCAQHHVEPDFVLSDVRSAKARSITEGKLIEVVRLQLLHHRVSFRYNQLFSFHVSQLVDTLLALNQPEAALRYIIRDGVVQVSDDDLIACVVRLFEMEAIPQGRILLEALEVRGRQKFGDALESGNLTIDAFYTFFASHTLMMYSDPSASRDKFVSACSMIFGKLLPENDDNSEQYRQFVNDVTMSVMGFNTAFLLWYYNHNIRVSELKEKNVQFKTRDAGFWCKRIQFFKLLEESAKIRTDEQLLYTIAEDAIVLVNEAGFQEIDLPLLLTSTIEYGNDSASIMRLGEQYLNITTEGLFREENGVDLNRKYLAQHQLRARTIGYRSELDRKYPIVGKPTPHAWEQQLINLISYVGHLEGQLYRLRSDKLSEQFTAQYKHIQKLEQCLDFPLAERGHWERSYALPEALFPYIYRSIAQLHVTFFPDHMANWLNRLLNRAGGQLGIYTEGFRECLFQVIDVTVGLPEYRLSTFKVLEHLERHVENGVQNRWERTYLLLRIAELYSLNGNLERGNRTFANMLHTSMGPSWYKEDQFALVPTVIKHASTAFTPTVGQLLSHLDAASAEMTFQRYIQQEKSSLPGTLAERCLLSPAIAYYKNETIPDAATAIANAEGLPIDLFRQGEGYRLGGRNLTEASAIVGLLEALPDLHPAIILAFCKVFTHNDDTWRYARDFGKLHGQSLSRLLDFPNVKHDTVIVEWYQWWLDSSLTDKEIQEYWPHFCRSLSEKVRSILAEVAHRDASLTKSLMQSDAHKDEVDSAERYQDDVEFTGFPGTGRQSTYQRMKTVLQQVADEDAMDNHQRASGLLKGYVDELAREGWEVWTAENYSHDMGQLMASLVGHAQSGAQLVQALELPINDSSYWSVANRLIQWGSSKLDDTEREQLASVVSDHLQALTQTPAEHKKKYNWLASLPTALSADGAMIDLFIWHLQHPSESWRARAEAELLRLAYFLPDLVLTSLLGVAIGPFVGSVNLLAASLLPQLVQDQPIAFSQLLANRPDLAHAIGEQRHLLIKHNLSEALSLIAASDSDANQLQIQLKNSIPNIVILSSEIYLDEPYLRSIQHEIRILNDLNLLNRAFCEDLSKEIQTLCAPLTINEHFRADRYIKRSFNSADDYCPPFEALLHYALCCAILPRVDRVHWSEVVSILSAKN